MIWKLSATMSVSKRWSEMEARSLSARISTPSMVRLRAENGELVATHAGEDLLRTQAFTADPGQPFENEIAAQVTNGVVDLLEVIDVEDHDRQRSLVPLGPGELSRQLFAELAPVGDLGQSILHHQLVDRLVVDRLDIFLTKELEMESAELDAIAAGEIGRPVTRRSLTKVPLVLSRSSTTTPSAENDTRA